MDLFAIVHELREHPFHSLKVMKFLADARKARIGHTADVFAFAASFESQELANLAEGKP